MLENELTVLTHHKCASTWLRAYLSDFCYINAIEMLSTHYSNLTLPPDRNVALFTNASYEFVSRNISEGLHVIRNPLDLIVSAYYSHKSTHPLDGWPELALQRQVLCSSNEHDGLFATLAFLERDDFYNGAVGPLHALRHWNFDDDRFPTLRMEHLVSNPSDLLTSVIGSRSTSLLTPDPSKYTFNAFTGREVGQVDDSSHYRSGKTDQWRGTLPSTIIQYVRFNYRSLLERFYPHSFDD